MNTISYEYDDFDRIKVMHKMDKDYYYKYDSNGNLSKILINNPLSTFDLPLTELEKEYDSIIKYTYDNGKKYDLKLTDEWKGKTVSYDGIIMEAQDIGNFNFGYIGRALGYDTEFLTFGAGVNQELNKNRYTPWCFTLSFCYDPMDSYYIRMGAIKYDNEN